MEIKVLNTADSISIKNTVLQGRTVEDGSGLKNLSQNVIQKVTETNTVIRTDASGMEGVKIEQQPVVGRVESTREILRRDESVSVQKVVKEQVVLKTTLLGPTGPQGEPGNVDDLVIPDMVQVFRDNL